MPRHLKQGLAAILLFPIAGPSALATEARTLDQLTAGWGQDLDNTVVESTEIRPGLYRLTGAGGAVLVSIGVDGVLMVDDQYAKTVGKLKAEVDRLGGGAVDFVVNTHWHFDHADGNPTLGADGARIIAHGESRERMMQMNRVSYTETHYDQPPYPAVGLPVITFDQSLTLHFNGQRIDVMHFGPGHTAGDAAVFFRRDNVVHMGDVFNARYPYIDAANGGSLAGLIAICRSVLDEVDDDTLIVSGHAPTADRVALVAYVEMLETLYGRIRALVDDGMSLDAILAANPTADFDADRGNPTLFITMAYRSLTR